MIPLIKTKLKGALKGFGCYGYCCALLMPGKTAGERDRRGNSASHPADIDRKPYPRVELRVSDDERGIGVAAIWEGEQ